MYALIFGESNPFDEGPSVRSESKGIDRDLTSNSLIAFRAQIVCHESLNQE
jgi:hypothetical protein